MRRSHLSKHKCKNYHFFPLIVRNVQERRVYTSEFCPHVIFGEQMTVFSSPQKYIQGPQVLQHLCKFLPLISSKKPIIIASKNGKDKVREVILPSFEASSIVPEWIEFLGECSDKEIERMTKEIASNKSRHIDSVIGIGGGKLIDMAKFISRNLDKPLMICPSLASNDSPCSSLSVMYTENGDPERAEYFKCNPNLVVVDSNIVLNSPTRTLVAGMGDAMAAHYEAKVCNSNPKAKNILGSRPTLAAICLSDTCKETLYSHSLGAIQAMKERKINRSLENVIEANTLLSGLAYESGGLAAAHAIAHSLTLIPHVKNNCMHGEMAAIGLLCQIIMLGDWEELERVANFLSLVGLPVHLDQLRVNLEVDDISGVVSTAVNSVLMRNMPIEVTAHTINAVFEKLNQIGERYIKMNGDKCFIPRI